MRQYNGFYIPETEEEMYQLHRNVLEGKDDVHGIPTIILPAINNDFRYIHSGIIIEGFVSRRGSPGVKEILRGTIDLFSDKLTDGRSGCYVRLWHDNVKAHDGVPPEFVVDTKDWISIQGRYDSVVVEARFSKSRLADNNLSVEDAQKILDNEAMSVSHTAANYAPA